MYNFLLINIYYYYYIINNYNLVQINTSDISLPHKIPTPLYLCYSNVITFLENTMIIVTNNRPTIMQNYIYSNNIIGIIDDIYYKKADTINI